MLSTMFIGSDNDDARESGNRDEDDSDESDILDEASADLDVDVSSDLMPISEIDSEHEDEQTPRCDDRAGLDTEDEPASENDRNSVIISLPTLGESTFEIDRVNQGIDEVRIESDEDVLRISWNPEESPGRLIIETDHSSVTLNFVNESTVPFSNIYVDAGQQNAGCEPVRISDLIENNDTTTLIVGIFNGESATQGVAHEVIGSDANDSILIIDQQVAENISYERGEIINETNSIRHVVASAGDDIISLRDGNYVAFGGMGADRITFNESGGVGFGGSGDDTISSLGAAVALLGDDGDDSISGSDLGDTILGGNGSDQIFGGDGADLISGHGLWLSEPAQRTVSLNDIISASHDTIFGGFGDDTMIATSGDSIFGGAGADEVLFYLQPNSEPAFFDDFSNEDTVMIDIVLDGPFDEGEEMDKVEIRTIDGHIEVVYDGSVVVVLSNESEDLSGHVLVRFSSVDMDRSYLG